MFKTGDIVPESGRWKPADIGKDDEVPPGAPRVLYLSKDEVFPGSPKGNERTTFTKG